jgi:histidine triad (HIT) family protein
VGEAAACVFCEIAAGLREARTVLEDAASLAFLDHRPLFPGHVLLVPRRHCETLVDLPADEVGPLFANARLLARAVPAALGAQGSFLAINNRVSQTVPHLHVHVVPRSRGDGLRGFFWPRRGYRGPEHAERTRAAIRQEVDALLRGEPARC